MSIEEKRIKHVLRAAFAEFGVTNNGITVSSNRDSRFTDIVMKDFDINKDKESLDILRGLGAEVEIEKGSTRIKILASQLERLVMSEEKKIQQEPSGAVYFDAQGARPESSKKRREAIGGELQNLIGARGFHYLGYGPMGYNEGNQFVLSFDIGSNDPNVTDKIIDKVLIPIRQKAGLTKEDISFTEKPYNYAFRDDQYKPGNLQIIVKDRHEAAAILAKLRPFSEEIKQGIAGETGKVKKVEAGLSQEVADSGVTPNPTVTQVAAPTQAEPSPYSLEGRNHPVHKVTEAPVVAKVVPPVLEAKKLEGRFDASVYERAMAAMKERGVGGEMVALGELASPKVPNAKFAQGTGGPQVG